MQLELTMGISPLSREEQELVEQSIEILPTAIYIRRTYEPTPSRIVHFSTHLISAIQQTNIRTIIGDYRYASPPTHRFRRLTLEKLKPILNEIDKVIFIVSADRKGFQRVMLEFFVKAYLTVQSTNVYFCDTRAEAEAIADSLS